MASLALGRYEKLGLRESMSRAYDYPSACKELSFILRGAYNKVPKNLQFFMFEDTLTAFRLLPNVHTSSGVSAAGLLLQAAEFALPKQKRGLAVTEFKHAVVAHKRHSKACQREEGSVHLPQDILVHVFSFLDMRSLVVVGSVCCSWNLAASDNRLWQSQYALFFGKSDIDYKNEEKIDELFEEWGCVKKSMDPEAHLDWKESFKRKYIGESSWRSTSIRGYCGCCKALIWLSNMKCASLHQTNEKQKQKIKPVSPQQVVGYLLGESLCTASSDSDSDSDSERAPFSEHPLPRLWAYPRHIGGSYYPAQRRQKDNINKPMM